ncbi:uncharacterized protein [Musca autumnalis]|uniref:uncharacterized protein n=1 Tax=Musca autumnalis TaxID=221902 RepID=UPI003CFBA414
MSCFTVRCWSLLLAWFALILTILGSVLAVLYLHYVASGTAYSINVFADIGWMMVKAVFSFIACVICSIICILLLVGIYQNRLRSMAVYIHITISAIVVGTIGVIILFIMELAMDKRRFSIMEGVLCFLGVAFEILIFTPIYIILADPDHFASARNQ